MLFRMGNDVPSLIPLKCDIYVTVMFLSDFHGIKACESKVVLNLSISQAARPAPTTPPPSRKNQSRQAAQPHPAKIPTSLPPYPDTPCTECCYTD